MQQIGAAGTGSHVAEPRSVANHQQPQPRPAWREPRDRLQERGHAVPRLHAAHETDEL